MLLFCCLVFLSAGAPAAFGAATGTAAEADGGADLLPELSLEQLMQVTMTSPSRKSQTLLDVSSAVFVINQEDIRRSGATTIPDLLRMVPGVQVASIDGNTWAISIRGFNGTFANKLLVMIDGRSVYTPLYGGVFWEVQDTVLEDIERIEVIRGSGSTVWGANAVNGVISIITKNAQDTNGTRLTGLAGNRERGSASVRYGSAFGEHTNYRIYAKYLNRGDTVSTSTPAGDAIEMSRGGFRIDSLPTNDLTLTLQGDLYGGSAGKAFTVPTLSSPFNATLSQTSNLFGANLLSRIDWLQSETSKASLQLYYDRTSRDTSLASEGRDTVDLDLQHNWRVSASHELTWGAGYRFLHDTTKGTRDFILLTPESRSEVLLNLFLLDEITLLPETLRLSVGTKLEHTEFTGWGLQPSARLLWTPHRGYSVWGAVTRSTRTPSRGEQDAKKGLQVLPPSQASGQLPTVLLATGNRQLDPESLLAYEVGFRADLSQSLAVDISTFYNLYHGIIFPSRGTPFRDGTQVTVPLNLTNANKYQSSGAELALQWQPYQWWTLKGGYAYIHFTGAGVDDSLAIRATPAHQGTLRSMFSLRPDLDLDLWARYVAKNRYPFFNGTGEIPAYLTMDLRLAWRPVVGLELSLVGQNLLDDRHLESVSDLSAARHEVQRTVYGKAAWAF
jgi:iron complex outermembrane receptor protein